MPSGWEVVPNLGSGRTLSGSWLADLGAGAGTGGRQVPLETRT